MEIITQDRIEIALSRTKLRKGLMMSILFLLLGLWIVIFRPVKPENSPLRSPELVYGAAILSIAFALFGIFYFPKKMKDKRPGIVIDEEGVSDNSSAVSIGLIPWADVLQLKVIKVVRQEFLVLIVNNPESYISRQTNLIKKKGMQYNYRNYGSPLAISTGGLECTPDKLKEMVESRLAVYKTSQAAAQ